MQVKLDTLVSIILPKIQRVCEFLLEEDAFPNLNMNLMKDTLTSFAPVIT